MTFLCWNLNKRPLHALVAKLVASDRVDVVILIECTVAVGDVLRVLNETTGTIFHHSVGGMKSIRVFTRFSNQFIHPVAEGPRFSVRRLETPAQIKVLLVVVHLLSKMHWSEESQALECTRLASEIRLIEKRVGHCRTILVGDLNMNPFEKGMVGAAGLNATMARNRALKETRTVQRREYPFFYNPMWGHFGDRDGGPPGTYHYSSSEHVAYFWNMFDQVLVRPSLIELLDVDRIRIADRVNDTSLLTSEGTPDPVVASDHLPLLFSLNL